MTSTALLPLIEAPVETGWFDALRPVVSDGWLLAAAFFALSIWMGKKWHGALQERAAELKAYNTALEAERARLQNRLDERTSHDRQG